MIEISEQFITQVSCLLFAVFSLLLIAGYIIWTFGEPHKTRTLKELFEKIFKWRST